MHTTANPDILMPQRSSSLAWIFFGVAVVSGLGGIFVQKQKLDVTELRAAAVADSEKTARTQLAEAVSANHALEVKVQDLSSENARLKAKSTSVASASIAAAPVDHEKASKKKARKHHKRH